MRQFNVVHVNLKFASVLTFVLAIPVCADTFTWQGKLVDGELAAEGVYDLQFSLWDAAGGGNQIDITLAADDVLVVDGLLTVDLDFTDPTAFDGSARWLEINVKADADATYDTLSPRQPVHATPYAMHALSVADAAVPFSFSGADGVFTGGKVGIGTVNPGATLDVVSSESIGISSVNALAIGVFGRLSAPTGADFGIWGESASTTGTGLYGFAGATSGTNFGLHAVTLSPDGYAGYFEGGRNYFEGNVGIGTSAPKRRLHVASGDSGVTPYSDADLVIEDEYSAYINLLTPDTHSSGIHFGNPTGGYASGRIEFSSNGFRFGTGGSLSRMAIDSSGNVGVGTSIPNFGRLEVRQDVDSSATGLAVVDSHGLRAFRLWVDANDVSRIDSGGFGSESLALNEGGGNVGIGTASPASPLHVVESQSGHAVIIQGGTDGVNPNIRFEEDGGQSGNIRLEESHPGGAALELSAGTSIMTLTQSGNVGIGTDVPDRLLHVSNGDAGVTANTNADLVIEDDHTVYLNLLAPETNECGVLFGNPVDFAAAGGLVYNAGGTPDGMQFRTNGNNTRMVIQDDGDVGIGTTTPAFKLEVNGSAGKPGGGSWSVSSDRRLKKNISNMEGSLDRLMSLRGVMYEYKDPDSINERQGEQIGMIAQEVEKVFPDWVTEGGHGYKTITFRGFEALTVEALREIRQEKDRQMQSLQDENELLRSRIEAIETQMRELRQMISPTE